MYVCMNFLILFNVFPYTMYVSMSSSIFPSQCFSLVLYKFFYYNYIYANFAIRTVRDYICERNKEEDLLPIFISMKETFSFSIAIKYIPTHARCSFLSSFISKGQKHFAKEVLVRLYWLLKLAYRKLNA